MESIRKWLLTNREFIRVTQTDDGGCKCVLTIENVNFILFRQTLDSFEVYLLPSDVDAIVTNSSQITSIADVIKKTAYESFNSRR